jgi:hypothetical protein
MKILQIVSMLLFSVLAYSQNKLVVTMYDDYENGNQIFKSVRLDKNFSYFIDNYGTSWIDYKRVDLYSDFYYRLNLISAHGIGRFAYGIGYLPREHGMNMEDMRYLVFDKRLTDNIAKLFHLNLDFINLVNYKDYNYVQLYWYDRDGTFDFSQLFLLNDIDKTKIMFREDLGQFDLESVSLDDEDKLILEKLLSLF